MMPMPLRILGGTALALGLAMIVCSYALAEYVSWDGLVFYLGFGLMIVGTIAHAIGLIQERRNK